MKDIYTIIMLLNDHFSNDLYTVLKNDGFKLVKAPSFIDALNYLRRVETSLIIAHFTLENIDLLNNDDDLLTIDIIPLTDSKERLDLLSSEKKLNLCGFVTRDTNAITYAPLIVTQALKYIDERNKKKECKKRFLEIVKSSGDFVWEVDVRGRYTFVTPLIEDIMGYRIDEVLGRSFFDFYHPDDMAELKKAAFETFLEKENFNKFISRNIHSDGSIVILETSGFPVLDVNNDLIGYRGANKDVTRRVIYEQELLESKSNLAQAQKIAKVGSWDWHIKDGTLLWSDQTYLAFGFKPGEVKPSYELFLEFVHPDDKVKLMNSVKKSLDEKVPYDVTVRVLMRDKSEWIMHAIGEVILDENGEVERLSGTQQNITKKKSTEDMLFKMNNAINQAAEVFIIADSAGLIEYANPSVKKVTGYIPEELIGKHLDVFMPDKVEKTVHDDIWNNLNNGKVWRGELSSRKKFGELYEEELTATPVINSEGAIVNFVVVKKDISQEKKLKTQLMHAEKLSTIGRFVAGVAHEINNPLTSVLGYSEILLEQPDLSPDAKHKIEIIFEQAGRTAQIVKNLLIFSRKHKLGKKNTNINKALEETLRLNSYRLKSSQITILKEYEEIPFYILIDSSQLQQVFLNILLNATQHIKTSKGFGTIKISTWTKNTNCYVSFENDGPKIHEYLIEKIFDPFFTTKKVGEGTGLGLYVSYNIIKEHDGDIHVENLGENGVKFTIRLPCLTEFSKEEVLKNDIKVYGKDIIKILFVDDEETLRLLIFSSLSCDMIEVDTAANGHSAIAILKEKDFDYIVSDLKMPQMNGFELGDWVKKNKNLKEGAFIIATGFIDEHIEKICEESGFGLIDKPYNRNDILDIINNY